MQRRDFIKITAAGGAAAALEGCGNPDHQLIRFGPYAYIRHPIYSGLILAMAGTAFVIGEWRAVVAVLLAVVELSRKASKEEALLATEFGEQYREYRRQAGFLTPRFR